MAASSRAHEGITKKLKTKIWPPGPEALRPEKKEKRHFPEVPAESSTSAPVPKNSLTKGKQPAEESSAYYEAGGRTFLTIPRSKRDYILKPEKEDQGENKISTGHEDDNYEQGSKTKGKQRDAEEDLPPRIIVTSEPSRISDDHRSFDSLELRSLVSRATLPSSKSFRDWPFGGSNRQLASSSSHESLSGYPEIPASRGLPVPRNYYTNAWKFSQGLEQLRSPLVEASQCDDTVTLNILIDKGAEIDMQFAHGQYGSALVAASVGQFPDNVKVLLDRGADVNLQVAHGLYGSALVAASFSQYPENVNALLDRGADVNLQVVHGKFGSALAAASESPRTSESVKILLEAGADVNLPLSFGSFNDAMSVAVYSRNATAIKLLFEAGAKISPLVASLIQRAASNDSAFCNVLKGMASEYTYSPETLRLKFYCELPSLAADRDGTEWLFNMGVLIRKKDTVEFATLQDYLSRSFDTTGLDLLRGIIRALETPLNLYC
jgi:ankyrin repeat protein